MDHIDYDAFNHIKTRMKDKFVILLGGYLKESKGYLTTIAANMPDGDLAMLIEAAHSLKSSSGLLGIKDVYKTAETLEYAAKDLQDSNAQTYESLQKYCAALNSAFSAVEGDLYAELQRL